MKRAFHAAVAVAAIIGAGAALANDSTAEMTAGGLVLKNSRNIDMLEEDLYVSAEQIRVSYVFRNQGAADEQAIVAFPMPDRDLSQEGYGDVAHVRDFATTVEGRSVATQVERKAMLGAVDHTALLTRLGMPVAPPIAYVQGDPDPILAAWRLLSDADKQRLRRLALVEEEGDTLRPLWTVKETFYWTQTFPAGRDLRIRHSYRPGTGGSVGALLAYPHLRREPAGRQMIRDYCADQAFLAGADRLRREAGENGIPSEQRFGYILRTGGNWRSPIRSFRLVVDKGDPRNIVSFCGTGVRRISPTQFEMRRTNWRPDRDLRVLIIQPYRPYTGD